VMFKRCRPFCSRCGAIPLIDNRLYTVVLFHLRLSIYYYVVAAGKDQWRAVQALYYLRLNCTFFYARLFFAAPNDDLVIGFNACVIIYS
jgi:hypothetical protein